MFLVDEFKVVCVMLMTAVRVPASVVVRLAGDLSVRCVSNGAPQLASTVILEAWSICTGLLRAVLELHNLEILGLMFLPTIWIPTSAILTISLTRNFAMMSIGDCTPQRTGTVILEALRLFVCLHEIEVIC